jgi:hypothetical protein
VFGFQTVNTPGDDGQRLASLLMGHQAILWDCCRKEGGQMRRQAWPELGADQGCCGGPLKIMSSASRRSVHLLPLSHINCLFKHF